MPELLTILEIIATITGIACVYLQTREIIWAWPFGIISVTCLIYIFFQSNLYSDVILHVVLLVLNIYGWINWYNKRKNKTEEAPILSLNKLHFGLWGITIFIGASLWGYGMKTWTGADLVYLDAFTTVGSLCAQYLLAQKFLENWIFWIIVDVVAVNVYLYKGIYLTSFLFFVFLLLAIKGYVDWKRAYKEQINIVSFNS